MKHLNAGMVLVWVTVVPSVLGAAALERYTFPEERQIMNAPMKMQQRVQPDREQPIIGDADRDKLQQAAMRMSVEERNTLIREYEGERDHAQDARKAQYYQELITILRNAD